MDIAKAFKEEVCRLTRKELRVQLRELELSAARFRKEVVVLNRRLQTLESTAKKLVRESATKARVVDGSSPPKRAEFRFSAEGIAAERKRLGLSAAEMASLLGVTGQSVYLWEQGKSRPRAFQMSAISAVRKMGKREAAYRLSVIQG